MRRIDDQHVKTGGAPGQEPRFATEQIAGGMNLADALDRLKHDRITWDKSPDRYAFI
jgi:hypothetical protein